MIILGRPRNTTLIKVNDVIDDMLVIKDLGKNENRQNIFLVECCICKRQKIMKEQVINKNKGTTHKSCGKGIKTIDKRFYSEWTRLRQRTTNPNYEFWNNYGGRGIKSDAFENFIDFYDTMYESYKEHIAIYGEDNTTIDRMDVNGNYCPENCRWATWEIQKSNTTKNKYFKAISPEGEVFTSNNQCKFAREHELCSKQINACLTGRFKTHLNWKFEYLEM